METILNICDKSTNLSPGSRKPYNTGKDWQLLSFLCLVYVTKISFVIAICFITFFHISFGISTPFQDWFLKKRLGFLIEEIRQTWFLRQYIKAWFPPMRLTYSHVYPYENKHNPIGGNASNNLKKKKKKSCIFSWDYSFIILRIIWKRFDIIPTVFL